MRNRDFFLPSATTFVVFFLSFFLSCAHQNRVHDGIDAGVEQTEETTDTAANELETVPPSDDIASTTTPPETQAATGSDADLAALGLEEAPQQTGSNTIPPASDELAPIPQETPSEMQTGASTAELAPPTMEEPPKEEPVVQAEATPPQVEEPVVKKTASFWSGSRVPKIPKSAVKRNGVSLNRFYFVRKGDTSASVATLIYGSNDHRKDLAKWNKGAWTPGRVVYYASPVDAADRSMGSFYKEKGIEPEEYTVSRGDWLSRVAQKKLGSSHSWKEIAVVNGLRKADAIEVGDRLAIYPRDLAGFVAKPQQPEPVAEAQPEPQPEVTSQPMAQAPVEPQVVPQPQPQEQVAPEEPVVEQPTAITKKPVDKEPQVDIGKFVEQNFIALVLIVAMVLLLVSLASRRKKRRLAAQNRDEMGDDFETPPSKMKRK